MAVSEYASARKLAQKQYRQDLAEKHNPNLRVLDEILPMIPLAGEQDLGLIEIPLNLVAGTKTAGRTSAFASNFMPLLPEDTEFASKWSSLFDAHIEEGIREPVIACEFLNSYYVIEGNKRVSVLKYAGAVSVSGYVTRIIPQKNGTDAIEAYYEFMEFNRFSGINTLYFSRTGCFQKFCRLAGKPYGEMWTEDERRIFSYRFYIFSKIYERKGIKVPDIAASDAFLLYLEVYGYDSLDDKSTETLRSELTLMRNDLTALFRDGSVNLVLKPGREPEKNLIQKLIAPSAPRLKAAFLYYKTAKSSSWTYSHDLGRLSLETTMAGKVEIAVYDGLITDEDCSQAIEQAIQDGCTVIFTTSPRFLGASMKAGIRHPQIKVLNCSLNTYTGHMRTYYGRLYEAKFLVGILAGILTRTNQIGYISDFPIFGSTANINAFALGVKMVNPTAIVHLEWSSRKGIDIKKAFSEANVSHICGRDMVAPLHSSRVYGLYDLDRETGGTLAASIWHWGRFYQRILQTILNGRWKQCEPSDPAESVNYWWGISSGMIDIICSKSIPQRTLTLMELLKKQIASDEFQIFSGEIYDQSHGLRHQGNDSMTPEEIIRMDWLCDNVKGAIPQLHELEEEAIPMVQLQGILQSEKPL